MERDTGSALPELFPSAPGMVFPLYHVFADIAEWQDGSILECRSNRPLAVTALAVESQGSLHLLIVNLTGTQQPVVVSPLGPEQAALRSRDANTAQKASYQPTGFRPDPPRV